MIKMKRRKKTSIFGNCVISTVLVLVEMDINDEYKTKTMASSGNPELLCNCITLRPHGVMVFS